MKRKSAPISCLILALSFGWSYRSPERAVAQSSQQAALPAYETLLKGATVHPGVFTLYQQKDKWYFEIPKAVLGREMLWYVEAARVPGDFPEGVGDTLGSALVRWERRKDRIFVSGYDMTVQKRAGIPSALDAQKPGADTDPANLSLNQSGEPATLFAFPIAAESPAGDVVIDVTNTFLTESADLNVKGVLSLGGLPGGILDPQKSYVDYIKAFPRNIEASSHLTYSVPGKKTVSVAIHHSLSLLPEVPMKPRLYDDRLGFFQVNFSDYSGENTVGVEQKGYIARYRLDKKDPTAALSEPVKPIVYYIGREVPEKWRPYFKQAVEDWNEAFEAAGFKNAILARDAPSLSEDPDWSSSDLRYSVIRWISTPTINARGPQTTDPRTGEILSAHVMIFANVVTLAQQWYYSLCSANDPRARMLPLPDEIVGRVLRYAVAHEVGHSLGLRHNHRASTAYTVKQLRDKAFTATHGSTASIMAYGRMNYVAQPEDGLSPDSLMPRIGPYDKHVIAWGYTPIPEAKTPQEEFPTLDAWAAKAVQNPWLVWSGDTFAQLDPRIVYDPRVLMQNVGAERIEATRLGLKNLERALAYLPAASMKKGRDFQYAQSFYEAIMGAWLDHIGSVVKEIGGVEENRTFAGRGKQFQRVPRTRQKAALGFVLEHGLRRPSTFMPASLYADIQPYALVDTVLDRQTVLLNALLSSDKASVMHDAALMNDPDRYPYIEYLSDLSHGLFEEVQAANPRVDPLRRSLQRRYITLLTEQLTKTPIPSKDKAQAKAALGVPGYVITTLDTYVSDYRASAMTVLQELAVTLKRAASAAKDQETRAHLYECERLVESALKAGEAPAK